MSNPSIILIGPSKAGKTVLMKLLGAALERPYLDLDDLRWNYYAEIGYDPERAQQIRREQGMWALAEYWKPFDIHGVERVLQDYPEDHILAFGAGHSVYADPDQFARAQTALSSFPVILLLPSPDVEESVRITKERLRSAEPDFDDAFYDTIAAINRSFIEHPSNGRLATLTVYTHDKHPDQTCVEILQQL